MYEREERVATAGGKCEYIIAATTGVRNLPWWSGVCLAPEHHVTGFPAGRCSGAEVERRQNVTVACPSAFSLAVSQCMRFPSVSRPRSLTFSRVQHCTADCNQGTVSAAARAAIRVFGHSYHYCHHHPAASYRQHPRQTKNRRQTHGGLIGGPLVALISCDNHIISPKVLHGAERHSTRRTFSTLRWLDKPSSLSLHYIRTSIPSPAAVCYPLPFFVSSHHHLPSSETRLT